VATFNPEVIVCNIKKRFTGVSGTINALVPVQARTLKVAYLGSDIPAIALAHAQSPERFRRVGFLQALWLSWRRLPDGRRRIWHVRRDPEMLLGIVLRDVLRLPIALVFTSAAKHRHSWFPRWLISRMDGVVSTTPEAASFVPNTTRVVPHGISLERFSPPADKLAAWSATGLPGRYGVGVFGRVRPDKGSDIFVDAMLRVLPEFPDFRAVIAGLAQPQHAAFQAQLQQRVDAQGMSERIRFLGEVAPDQVGQWYRNVLITVACPRYEPFGLTPLEGMACGCAVVASDTGAFRMIVDEGVTGHVVPTDDVDALAGRLRLLMQDPLRAVEMGRRGRERVERTFSVEREAEGIAAVYDTVWQRTAQGTA
jgi:mannosyltransferase